MQNEKPEIVFATNNAHKLAEARKILGDRIRLLSLSEIGCHDDIPETADTLEGNALIKARWVRDRYHRAAFADDTGLMVDALGGEPGVRTARYAGEHCTPEDNIDKLLCEMATVPDGVRAARFATVVAYVDGSEERTFLGVAEGEITRKRTGSDGFGYDPVFRSSENGLTFAQMGGDAKNALSHRGKAMRAFADYIRKHHK